MAAKLEEIAVIYRRERIRFKGSDVAILECDWPEGNGKPAAAVERLPQPALDALLAPLAPACIIKTTCEPDELSPGLTYRFYGQWLVHPKHGKQFQAKTFIRSQPHGRQGVIRYLQTTCHDCGIGQSTAAALWEKFGGDAVRILREQPDVAVAAVHAAGMKHFTEAKAAKAADVLKNEVRLEAVSIDLIDLLGGRGLPRSTAKRLVKDFGNKAAEIVRRNPYVLMRYRGCGFLRTDAMYLDLGGDPNNIKRQARCAWYAIASDTEGHTWHPPAVVEKALREKVAGTRVRAAAAVILARRAGGLATKRDGEGGGGKGRLWIAEKRKAENEATVAERVKELMEEKSQWPKVEEHQ